ncbi:hypothetical protein Tco_1400772 [Tanacetum coccineum]
MSEVKVLSSWPLIHPCVSLVLIFALDYVCPLSHLRIAKVELAPCGVGLKWESNGFVLGCRGRDEREAFSLARITEARFEDQRSSSFSNQTSSNNRGMQNQNLTMSRFTMPYQEPVNEVVFVKSTAGLEANKVINDGDGELETKVLVDGKQDDVKVVKVVGVADEQNSDEQNVLEGNGVIGVGRLNDKYIKKKKIKVAFQRR